MNSIRNLVLASLLGGASCLQAQFSIGWSTIDGGGGPSGGGGFSLNGTLGQPDAGAMSGGLFTLGGGFWPGVTAPLAGPPPVLSIRLGTAGNVILNWPHPSTGYVLERTFNMNAPGGGWTDVTQPPVIVGPNLEVTLPATGSFALFRLRGP